MKIHIDFQGLNRIACKLGLHIFTNWEKELVDSRYVERRYCDDCPRFETRKIKTK